MGDDGRLAELLEGAMTRETWPPRCHFCGHFMSYKDLGEAMSWTPFGDASMTEPPPEEFAHLCCWKAAPDGRRELVEAIAWAKPHQPSM